YSVTAILHITLIGIAIVYLLLSAQIAQSMMSYFFYLDYGYWIIILSVFLCPLTWFGSIEEFWFAAIGALVTAALACYSLLASVILEIPNAKNVKFDNPNFSSFSLAFGTILFSFGGVFFFPTIQNDMANRQQFNKATLIGFAGLLLLYMPVTTAGYAVLGSSVAPNILLSIEVGYLRSFIEACLAAHILLAFLIVINPVAQETEDALGVEPNFNYKRCIIRSLIVGLVLLISYTIPHFDKIMNLIGGSTMTLLTFIFPPLFYIQLCNNDESKLDTRRKISLSEKGFLIQVMAVGIAGGIACTYFALMEIVSIFFSNTSASVVDINIAI
ncbi:amino acid transporter AVT1H-like, partial [Stegodyphus dumicola]|uniref:amino acid transporter AVT1H-like n=1 Tax=Stegodyphus dumicola TaxID=202533 RepID=UPI0015AE29D0